MKSQEGNISITLDKKEAVSKIKKHMLEKWDRKYKLSDKVDYIQEVFTEVGKRNCMGQEDCKAFSILNGNKQLENAIN